LEGMQALTAGRAKLAPRIPSWHKA
jgi:hypothetical protein